MNKEIFKEEREEEKWNKNILIIRRGKRKIRRKKEGTKENIWKKGK